MDADAREADVLRDGSRNDVEAPLRAAHRFDPRTRMLLEGSIMGTLLRLATPNVLVMFVQAAVGLIETYFVAKLGTDALAGVALAAPGSAQSPGDDRACSFVTRISEET